MAARRCEPTRISSGSQHGWLPTRTLGLIRGRDRRVWQNGAIVGGLASEARRPRREEVVYNEILDN